MVISTVCGIANCCFYFGRDYRPRFVSNVQLVKFCRSQNFKFFLLFKSFSRNYLTSSIVITNTCICTDCTLNLEKIITTSLNFILLYFNWSTYCMFSLYFMRVFSGPTSKVPQRGVAKPLQGVLRTTCEKCSIWLSNLFYCTAPKS